MVPEAPRDLGLGQVALDPISDTSLATPPMTPTNLEVLPHAAVASGTARPETTPEAASGSGAPSEDPEAEDPAEEDAPGAEHVVSRPQLIRSSLPWPLEQDRREREGWE